MEEGEAGEEGVEGGGARGSEPRPYTSSDTLFQSREPVWPSGKAL